MSKIFRNVGIGMAGLAGITTIAYCILRKSKVKTRDNPLNDTSIADFDNMIKHESKPSKSYGHDDDGEDNDE